MKSTVSASDVTMAAGRTTGALAVEMSRFGLKMFGVGTAWIGTFPKLGDAEWIIQVGRSTTAATVFPKPFPKGAVVLITPTAPATTGYLVSGALTGFTASVTTYGWIAVGC